MYIFSTQNLVKNFDTVSVVARLSIGFERGKITSIVGPNGSGKTTLVNLLSGVLPITSGTITIAGKKLRQIQSYDIAGLGITRTFQEVRVFEQMSALDNILVVMTDRRVSRSLFENHSRKHLGHAEEMLRQVGLFEKRNEMAETLSYGQRKLLEIARVLAIRLTSSGHGAMKIYLFDEPFAGLFPEMRKVVVSAMKKLRREGKTLILIEHNMDIIRELSDHLVVLDAGRLLSEGTPARVLKRREVIEAYLGE